jgi:hypothetical protein
MHARVTRLHGDARRMEEGERWFQEDLLPRLERLPGYRDAMLLIDREHGESLAIVFWDSKEAMQASEGPAAGFRVEAEEAMRASITMIERFELAVQASALTPH